MTFPDWGQFGPKMLALRERERRFVWAYLMNALYDGKENGAQAARDAGYSDVKEGAKVRAHGLLHREDVLEAMTEVSGRELRGLAIPAVVALSKLIAKPDHADHRKSIEMVLNRVGHSERTAVDVNVSGSVTMNHTAAALEDLRIMRDMGAPREKLLEAFGFSGLPRLEKMLAEIERRAGGSVIEGEVVRDGG
jgi:hypothetical protein